jgi:iron(II)-dependent oxidoreductase
MNTRALALDLNDISQLRAALLDARAWTLAIYSHLTPMQWQVPYLAIINPPLWEIGHVGWFQEYWCLRQRQDASPLPPRLKNADRLYDSRHVPHAERWNLPLPKWEDLLRYLDAVLHDTLVTLDRSTLEQRYFFRLALYHEDMHTEAMMMTLQTLGYPAPALPLLRMPPVAAEPAVGDAFLAGGAFRLGAPAEQDFAFDNEKWAHPVTLPAFSVSSATVTNRSFAGFVDAGGYHAREFWSDAGWQWREAQKAEFPRYWRKDNRSWLVRRFDQWRALPEEQPVMHVNCHEAEAWCRWAGRRLPSEAEWEYAARAGHQEGSDRYPWGNARLSSGQASLDNVFSGPVPAKALAQTDSPAGLRQMIGNVWEWTSSPFAPYPGFSPDPYKEYSEPWFHSHQVMRGGSFCTRSRLVCNRFRNFYTPERSDMFVGFRSCATR